MKKSLFLVVLAVLVAVFAVSCDGESAAAEPKKFTVKFESGVEGLDLNLPPQTVEEGKTAVKPKDPTRADHEFKGWKLEEEDFDFSTPITKDITLVASWGVTPPGPGSETKHTVTFVYDDGTTANQTKEVFKDSKVEKPADPTREGYAFKGWFEDGATAAFDFDSPITKNITLKAEWVEVHTVTFDVDGGTTISAQSVEHGKTAEAPENPTKTGHTFKYWSLDGSEFKFDTPIKKNITLKAEWVKTYTVTFNTDSNYASPVDSITVDENSKINEPETNRPGYRFDGWYSGDDKFDFKNTQINTDYELVAKWTQLFKVDSNGALEPTDEGKKLGNVVIPASIDGNTVKKIKQYAFQGIKGKEIKAVTIPSTVTTIEKFAFNACTGITSVTFGVGSMLDTIGESAFDGCTGITAFDIPASVTTIEKSAFSGCSGMTSVTFGTDSELATIGTSAFSSCSGITAFDIPASVTTIGIKAFESCTGLESITIPSGVRSVDEFAFQNCSSLETVQIECCEAVYGKSVFYPCTSLANVFFPEEMTSVISENMFRGCAKLEDDITIPKGVPSIGAYAFYGTSLVKAHVYTATVVDDSSFSCTVERYSE